MKKLIGNKEVDKYKRDGQDKGKTSSNYKE